MSIKHRQYKPTQLRSVQLGIVSEYACVGVFLAFETATFADL